MVDWALTQGPGAVWVSAAGIKKGTGFLVFLWQTIVEAMSGVPGRAMPRVVKARIALVPADRACHVAQPCPRILCQIASPSLDNHPNPSSGEPCVRARWIGPAP